VTRLHEPERELDLAFEAFVIEPSRRRNRWCGQQASLKAATVSAENSAPGGIFPQRSGPIGGAVFPRAPSELAGEPANTGTGNATQVSGHMRRAESKSTETALSVNPGTSVYLDEQRVDARNLEVPAGGGVTTARRHGGCVRRLRE
jgi:hypothetical protein